MAGPSACVPRSTTSTLERRISVETYLPGFGGMRDDPGLYGGLRDGFEYREVINKGHGGVDALEIFRQKFQRLGAKPLIMLIF